MKLAKEKINLRKVRVICQDIEDNKPVKSKSITVYGCDSSEVVDFITEKLRNDG